MAASEKDGARRNGQPPQGRDPDDELEEFQRFEELTRKLTRVPKSELDEKLKAAKGSSGSKSRFDLVVPVGVEVVALEVDGR